MHAHRARANREPIGVLARVAVCGAVAASALGGEAAGAAAEAVVHCLINSRLRGFGGTRLKIDATLGDVVVREEGLMVKLAGAKLVPKVACGLGHRLRRAEGRGEADAASAGHHCEPRTARAPQAARVLKVKRERGDASAALASRGFFSCAAAEDRVVAVMIETITRASIDQRYVRPGAGRRRL